MGAAEWIALAVAAGVGLVLWRQRSVAPAPGPSEGCGALGIPGPLCDLGLSLGSRVIAAVGETVNPQHAAANRALNGRPIRDVSEANAAATVKVTNLVGGTTATSYHRPVSSGGWLESGGGAVVEHENGCVPLAGHPGWAKCKPGTVDMRGRYPSTDTRVPGADYLSGVPWAGGQGDPLTRRSKVESDGAEVWFDRGARVRCPPGTTIGGERRDRSQVQDHRGLPAPGSAARCLPVQAVPPPVTAPPPVTVPPPPPRSPSPPRPRATRI